jgi:hypothetical protein
VLQGGASTSSLLDSGPMKRRTGGIPTIALVAALVAATVLGGVVASALAESSAEAQDSRVTTMADGSVVNVLEAKSLDEPWPFVGAATGLLIVAAGYGVYRWRSRRSPPAAG